MGKVFKILTAGLLAGLVHSPANAALVSFTGDGNFSTSRIAAAAGPADPIPIAVLKMSGASNQNKPSTLTITDITGSNISTNQNDYVIGKITWVNLATYNTDQNFNVKYTFWLNFTSPNNAFDAQVFNLNIQQTTNPAPDNAFTSARHCSTTLVHSPSTALRFPTFTSCDGSKWTNPEGKTSTLKILADFTFATAAPRSRNPRPGQ